MTKAWVAGPLLTLDGASQGQRRFPRNLPAQSPHTYPSPSPRASQPPVSPVPPPRPSQPSSQDAAAMGGGGRGMAGGPSLIRKVPNIALGDQQAAKPEGM